MFFSELETDRLFLKNISTEDRNFIFAQFSNTEVIRYLDAEPLTDIQEADELIDFYIQAKPRIRHRWVIVRKDDGIKLGTCGFYDWDKSTGSCSFVCDLFPDYWGNGYMYEAVKKILTFVKVNMKIKRIYACTHIDNKNAIKMVEKLGFVFTEQIEVEFITEKKKYLHKILTI